MGSSDGIHEVQSHSAERLRRKPSSQLLTFHARVEEMISSGAQCNVHSGGSPGSHPTPPSASHVRSLPLVDADPDCLFSMELEVDEAYCNSQNLMDEELVFAESLASLRRAGAPTGILRKQTVAGIPLRYQLSAEAALRCHTVVRSRPRMRKRKNTRTASTASSAVSSPILRPSKS